jgi:hypothetical protein
MVIRLRLPEFLLLSGFTMWHEEFASSVENGASSLTSFLLVIVW